MHLRAGTRQSPPIVCRAGRPRTSSFTLCTVDARSPAHSGCVRAPCASGGVDMVGSASGGRRHWDTTIAANRAPHSPPAHQADRRAQFLRRHSGCARAPCKRGGHHSRSERVGLGSCGRKHLASANVLRPAPRKRTGCLRGFALMRRCGASVGPLGVSGLRAPPRRGRSTSHPSRRSRDLAENSARDPRILTERRLYSAP